MEPIENTNEENLQDEIVTVEPGQEVLSVEEEITSVTPEEERKEEEKNKEAEALEEIREEVSEESEERVVEPEQKDKEEKKEEEEEEEPVEEEEPEKAKEVIEPSEEQQKLEEFEKVQAELQELREAERTRQMIEERETAAQKATQQYAQFNEQLKDAILDTFKQYGIDPDTNIEELQKDPAKYQIAQDIVRNAQRLQAEKQEELIKPVREVSNNIVFREAGRVMAQYEMTPEQVQVCSETLINIFDATGLADLKDDLKAKVELAVARAKMIAPKVEKVVEEVKEIVEDTKEAVKDVTTAEAESKEKTEKSTSVQKVIEEKPTIAAFKEGASVGNSDATLGDGVNKDNVLTKLSSLPFKKRTSFYLEHADLIDAAMREARAKLG